MSAEQLQRACDAAAAAIELAINQGASNEVSVVLFGVPDDVTQNPLNAEDPEQYVGVRQLTLLEKAGVAALKRLREVPQFAGGESGDILDAMVCAIKILELRTLRKQYRRRVCMATSAARKVEGAEQLEYVVDTMYKIDEMQCAFDVIGIDFGPPTPAGEAERDAQLAALDDEQRVKRQNEWMLRSTAQYLGGVVASPEEAIARAQAALKLQTPVLKGVTLRVGSGLALPLRVFDKVKRVSVAPPLGKETNTYKREEKGSGKVKQDSRLFSPDNPLEEMAFEDTARAYPFGSELRTVTKSDEALLELEPTPPGIDVIGVVPRSAVPQYLFMEGTQVVMARVQTPRTAEALSALARALRGRGEALIARYVKDYKYQGSAAGHKKPALVCLTPDDTQRLGLRFDRLLMHRLPFQEDLRDWELQSFDAPSRVPSAAQQAAADALIDAMMISSANGNRESDSGGKQVKEDPEGEGAAEPASDAVRAGLAINPVRQLIARAKLKRALEPGCELPTAPAAARAALEPDVAVLARARPRVDDFKLKFELRRREGRGGAAKRARVTDEEYAANEEAMAALVGRGGGGEEGEEGEEGGGERAAGGEGEGEAAAALRGVKVEPGEVGILTPVEDFERVLQRVMQGGDGAPAASTFAAIASMLEGVVFELIENGQDARILRKAADCCAAHARAAAAYGAGATYNAFLRKLRARFARHPVWPVLAAEQRCKPIVAGYAGGSDLMSAAEADAFFEVKAEPDADAAAEAAEAAAPVAAAAAGAEEEEGSEDELD
ncbi:SPOC like C-terminal domain-containing protein [Tribonema minus]|uniref:SPOC like C-terminal domain-containing protein n=1 Tax=Tribonema minus TaxID=303371 RepID=A0A835Z5D1_9STRA|nr:SPOC like C-terminal domain-containing protein [Tribonema minus]